MKTWIKRILLGLGAALLVAALLAAFIPLKGDPGVPPEKWGAGASSVLPSYSGLQREFPPTNETANNPTTPEKIELGRLLFFDAVLSKNNDMSCATCHNPDLGFSDGNQVALGADGVKLHRNAMSIWNVAYDSNFFWDGRAGTLEEQMLVPLTAADEMSADPRATEAELKAIPEYVTLFGKAFGGGQEMVTFENAQKAIAAFERSLVSRNSPFDRYAAGQFDALTQQQRRGLGLFRSAATRCFECHGAPTFRDNDFSVTGVPDLAGQAHDSGRAAIAPDGTDGAFVAPTLRNIALSAPYMHNGQFATLEEVVDFYAKGGGRPANVKNVDMHVLGFDLSAQEKADLVAFLYALTDESALPEFPASVPSGLPVVSHVDNPARAIVSQVNVPIAESGSVPNHEPTVLRVQPGETIQSVADRAGKGDTIEVPYGIYKESVVLDVSDLKLIGIPNDKGEWPILEGEGKRSDGVIASGNHFEMAFFAVKNYLSNGVLVEGATGVYLHDLYAENTGVYGIYPARCTDVLVERVEATLMNDAGIYAGKSQNVVVRDSVAYGNVIGVELENTVNGEIYNVHAYDNTLGIFIDLLPQLPSKVSLNTNIHDNISENNNGANFGKPGSAVALVPPGTGILILAADDVEIHNNTMRGNKSAGLAVFNLTIGFSVKEIDVDPNPDRVYAHDNTYEHNGYDADKFVKNLLGRGYEIIWDGSGVGQRFDDKVTSSFPPALPNSKWPTPLYNLYWRMLNLAVGLIG